MQIIGTDKQTMKTSEEEVDSQFWKIGSDSIPIISVHCSWAARTLYIFGVYGCHNLIQY